ncbi:hypothetical protein VL15_38290 [Burkholderia cepacia]|uniref:Uncharacterized protein n=1 Tax=Burkholderia cepacia TaxID=292 RepID=A0A0J5YRS7_BURCE|nr:hypothetical protein VL15_38290 [Burkholderia cepacia]
MLKKSAEGLIWLELSSVTLMVEIISALVGQIPTGLMDFKIGLLWLMKIKWARQEFWGLRWNARCSIS